MRRSVVYQSVLVLILFPVIVAAQMQSDAVPLRNWPAPLYWQPAPAERDAPAKRERFNAVSADAVSALTSPTGALVFVAMTPCRIVDTRAGSGFGGAFGPPSFAAGTSRTFPFQSSTTCPIPSSAQAYSIIVSVVPAGFLD